MKEDDKNFFNIELIIFLVLGIITIVEAYSLEIFNKIFLFIKPYASWFIGISFGFVFRNILNPFKKKITSHKKFIEKKEHFLFFVLNLIILAIIISSIQKIVISFFDLLLPYFHVLFFQWIVLIYIIFKLSNNYVLPKEYVITNEIIIVIYTILIYYIINF